MNQKCHALQKLGLLYVWHNCTITLIFIVLGEYFDLPCVNYQTFKNYFCKEAPYLSACIGSKIG